MTTNGNNRDQPKKMRTSVLDDKYIREFDLLMNETRTFHRELDEKRRRRYL